MLNFITQRLKSNFLFCQQLKDIQFAVIEEERNQKIFTLKKLESDNFDFFYFRKLLKSIIKVVSNYYINEL